MCRCDEVCAEGADVGVWVCVPEAAVVEQRLLGGVVGGSGGCPINRCKQRLMVGCDVRLFGGVRNGVWRDGLAGAEAACGHEPE